MTWLDTLASLAAATIPVVASNRCKTCYLKLTDDAAQWNDVFVCHLPPSWDSAFVSRLFNHVLQLAQPGDQVQQVESVFLVPRVDVNTLQHGFIKMTSHEAACFIVNEVGKSFFVTCGAYVGAHLNKNNMRLYLNLVTEQREVIDHYVSLSRMDHLERLCREQQNVIDTLVQEAQEALKRIVALEQMLLHEQGAKYNRVLPKV